MSPRVAWAVVVGNGALVSAGKITFSDAIGMTKPLAIFEDSAEAFRLAESMLNRRARVVRIRIAEDADQ